MKDIDLSISSIGTHDFLLNWLPDGDLLHQLVQDGEVVFPFLRRDNLDNARLHAIRIDFFHLPCDHD